MITWLSNLKLTLSQWALLALSATIGGLVIALRLQGSRLHRAQVTILADHIDRQDENDTEAVNKARDRFDKAYKAYKGAQ